MHRNNKKPAVKSGNDSVNKFMKVVTRCMLVSAVIMVCFLAGCKLFTIG